MEWFTVAKQVIENNGVILCPTDTVWGLSGNALAPAVIEKAYQIKNRPQNKSFILMMHSMKQLKEFVEDETSKIEAFLEQQSQPTTVIYNKTKHLPEELLAADGSIAIRIPKEKWLYDFLIDIDVPLISTSANISGEPTPEVFQQVSQEIISAVDYVVPHFPEATRHSSQIVKFREEKPIWLRR